MDSQRTAKIEAVTEDEEELDAQFREAIEKWGSELVNGTENENNDNEID